MPNRPKKPCKGKYGTCPNLVDANKRYCSSCQPGEVKKEKARTRQYDKQRGTTAQRGYDSRWNRVRALYIKRNPICENCINEGRTNKAEEVHHIIPIKQGGAKYSFDNLMSLCRTCHNKIEPRWHTS